MDITIRGQKDSYCAIKNIKGNRMEDKINNNNLIEGDDQRTRRFFKINLFDEEYEKNVEKYFRELKSDDDKHPEETANSTGIDLGLHVKIDNAQGNYSMVIRFDFEELEFMLEHAKKLKKKKIDKLGDKANKE